MRLTFLALCLAISSSLAQTREVVALARSEAPFLTGGSDAPGEGNVFEGESLESYYLPVWIDYRDGARYALGIGSAARLSDERIELQGVSLEIVSPGPNRRSIVAASFTFQPSSDCRGTIYLDSSDMATAQVSEGHLEVVDAAGELLGVVQSQQAKTFSRDRDGIRVQENRGPLEMARILVRELNYLLRLEEAAPPFGRKRRELLNRLVDSTTGVLMLDAEVRQPGLANGEGAAATIDPQQVLRTAAAVSFEIHHGVGWDRYGGGKPACATAAGASAGYPFGGDARLIPPQPLGCQLCEPEDPAAP
ncbi:MAG: hypothetical protein O3A53_04955 [Acidobacteria bacterium]|nr:hypothetical protein [Acidobacteriota bacterium]MDA1234129.1 hypothetical protein [Acidobacteriota bacterium]